VFNATFSNISAIAWRPLLVVEEIGVLGKITKYGKILSKGFVTSSKGKDSKITNGTKCLD
jgi:hypothetical protein